MARSYTEYAQRKNIESSLEMDSNHLAEVVGVHLKKKLKEVGLS